MVRKECFEGSTRHVESQLGELIFEQGFRNLVEFIKGDGGGGATKSNAAALGGEHSNIKVLLGGCKGA